MRIGMMNDPKRDALDEARWAAANGFGFLDLTIEQPRADVDQIDPAAIRAVLDAAGMGVVGHTAWYLPFGSPVERVRQAAVEEVAAALPAFAAVGAGMVNVHIVRGVHSFGMATTIAQNARCFAELAERAAAHGIQIVVEHPADATIGVDEVRRVLAADDRLGFHLDVGHANIGGDKLEGMLKAFGSRLAHVHMSDNRGRSDDHMPLGSGRINWSRAVRLLRATGYDGTITLEVFAEDRDYLLRSAEKLRRWWDAAGAEVSSQ